MAELTRPLHRDWPVSCGVQCHLDRDPPSTAPGVDFACPTGTPVYAAIGGRTSGCYYRTAGGRSIWITSPDGVKVYYAHLDQLCVLGKEDIYRGQLIGFSGNTGKGSTGPHLHLSVYVNGKPVDPLTFLP